MDYEIDMMVLTLNNIDVMCVSCPSVRSLGFVCQIICDED